MIMQEIQPQRPAPGKSTIHIHWCIEDTRKLQVSKMRWPRGRAGGGRPMWRKHLGQLEHIQCAGLTIHELCDLRQAT